MDRLVKIRTLFTLNQNSDWRMHRRYAPTRRTLPETAIQHQLSKIVWVADLVRFSWSPQNFLSLLQAFKRRHGPLVRWCKKNVTVNTTDVECCNGNNLVTFFIIEEALCNNLNFIIDLARGLTNVKLQFKDRMALFSSCPCKLRRTKGKWMRHWVKSHSSNPMLDCSSLCLFALVTWVCSCLLQWSAQPLDQTLVSMVNAQDLYHRFLPSS